MNKSYVSLVDHIHMYPQYHSMIMDDYTNSFVPLHTTAVAGMYMQFLGLAEKWPIMLKAILTLFIWAYWSWHPMSE